MAHSLCGSASRSTPTPPAPPSPSHHLPPGHSPAGLDGRGLKDLPVGQNVLSFFLSFFCFFNKTEQNKIKNARQLCVIDLFTTRDGHVLGVGRPLLHAGRTTTDSRWYPLLSLQPLPEGPPCPPSLHCLCSDSGWEMMASKRGGRDSLAGPRLFLGSAGVWTWGISWGVRQIGFASGSHLLI